MRMPALDALVVDRASGVSLQQQVCGAVKRLIHAGMWRAGQPVPSSRALAAELRLSRNTVTASYDRLVGEGYLDARPRSGLFVAASLAASAVGRAGPTRSARAATDAPGPLRQSPGLFRPCQPDVRLFPLPLWNRLRARCLRAEAVALLMYQSEHALGLPGLRRALADYLRESRGVRCEWRQVAITSGSQEALFMLAHLLLEPGGGALVEDPGYLGARRAWQARGARVDPVTVDEQGAVPPASRHRVHPTVIYTTPSRQFPTGACLPVARRLAWLAYARRHGAWLIEDDYDSEFRYGRAPMPSLHSLDTGDRVIYVGSMSKVLFPSLRIGFAVLPASLVDRFAALRAVVNDHGPLVDQATLAAFIEGGAFYTHIRRCRRHYGERREAFLSAASRAGLPLKFAHVDGGMNLMGHLAPTADDEAASAQLAGGGFDVPAVSSFAMRRGVPGLVFGTAAATVADIERALPRVSRLLTGGRPASSRRRPPPAGPLDS